MLVVNLKGLGENKNYPVAVLVIKAKQKKDINLRRQKLGPEYFWKVWAGLWIDVFSNSVRMPEKCLRNVILDAVFP